MASNFPDGSTIYIASAMTTAKNITAITNAAVAVATCTAHGLANGDVVAITSGWGEADNGVYKVESVTADTFKLLNLNTTDVKKFPAGQGVGSFRKVTFTQIRQIADLSTAGGEMQTADVKYLEDKIGKQYPTGRSARSMQFGIGDDPSLPGYKAAKAVSDGLELSPLRVDLPVGGQQIFFNGYGSLNEMPSMNQGELMKVQFDYLVWFGPNRY